jgi:hypothetical protein
MAALKLVSGITSSPLMWFCPIIATVSVWIGVAFAPLSAPKVDPA